MSIETDLERMFGDHAEDVRPQRDAFARVEAGLRRYHRRRAGAVGVLAAIAIVAGGIAVPRVLPEATPNFADPGDGPDQISKATLRPTHNRFFQLRYPSDWQIAYDGAEYRLTPPAADPTPATPPTSPPQRMGPTVSPFTFSIIHQDDLITDLIPEGVTLEDGYRLGGQPAQRGESVTSTERMLVYAADWTEPCACEIANLLVVVSAETPEDWERYGALAEAMIRTIEPTSVPPQLPLHTALGTVDFGVTFDAVTEMALKYLDTRLYDGAYDVFLTSEALAQYRAQGDPITNIEGADWLTYSVRARRDLPDGRVEFTVAMVTEASGPIRPGVVHRGETIERIIVGPGIRLEDESEVPLLIVGVSFDEQG